MPCRSVCSRLRVILPMLAEASPGISVTTVIWVTALHTRTPPGSHPACPRNVTKPRRPALRRRTPSYPWYWDLKLEEGPEDDRCKPAELVR
jgi:hypothetical protein